MQDDGPFAGGIQGPKETLAALFANLHQFYPDEASKDEENVLAITDQLDIVLKKLGKIFGLKREDVLMANLIGTLVCTALLWVSQLLHAAHARLWQGEGLTLHVDEKAGRLQYEPKEVQDWRVALKKVMADGAVSETVMVQQQEEEQAAWVRSHALCGCDALCGD